MTTKPFLIYVLVCSNEFFIRESCTHRNWKGNLWNQFVLILLVLPAIWIVYLRTNLLSFLDMLSNGSIFCLLFIDFWRINVHLYFPLVQWFDYTFLWLSYNSCLWYTTTVLFLINLNRMVNICSYVWIDTVAWLACT